MKLIHEASIKSGTLPLLFIHADLGTHLQWQSTYLHFKHSNTVISYDRRGHGKSPQPDDGRFGYEAEVKDLFDLVSSLEISECVLVAHSGGGAIAFLFANQYPDLVRGLFLVDPAQSGQAMAAKLKDQIPKRTVEDPVRSATEFYRSIAGDDEGIVERVLSDVKNTNPKTIVGTMSAMASFDPAAVELRFKGPALVLLQSQNDTPYSIGYLGYYLETHVDGLGHWIQMADPEHVKDELAQFLKFSEFRYGKSRSLEWSVIPSDNYVR